jgi:hypothetical protein
LKRDFQIFLAAIGLIATVASPLELSGFFWERRAVFAKIALTESEEELE